VIRGFLATRDIASAAPSPDPNSPLLGTYAAGDALADLRDAIRNRQERGVARRSSPTHLSIIGIGEATTNGFVAFAEACQIDDDVLFDIATGDIVDDSVVTRMLVAQFERMNGTWKVVGLALKAE
jgi:hypothetical protein